MKPLLCKIFRVFRILPQFVQWKIHDHGHWTLLVSFPIIRLFCIFFQWNIYQGNLLVHLRCNRICFRSSRSLIVQRICFGLFLMPVLAHLKFFNASCLFLLIVIDLSSLSRGWGLSFLISCLGAPICCKFGSSLFLSSIHSGFLKCVLKDNVLQLVVGSICPQNQSSFG